MADQMSHTDPLTPQAEEARRAVEAVLMVAEAPVEPQLLAQLLEVPVASVQQICRARVGVQVSGQKSSLIMTVMTMIARP